MTIGADESSGNYVIRVSSQPLVSPQAWNQLLAAQSHPTPFMRLEYLQALQLSLSACPGTGWDPRWVTVTQGPDDTQTHGYNEHSEPGAPNTTDAPLLAAAVIYIKPHSYGEYVFDWAWANAYEQHRLNYYPKGTLAVPFTPVPGSRLLAVNEAARTTLVQALLAVCRQEGLSSLHALFASEDDQAALASQGFMPRHTVQFHWHNRDAQGQPFDSFEGFLASLAQDKRKKIRQERRKVNETGVVFRHSQGRDISPQDWAFFYSCYERTYREHGNPPYLTPDFFERMANTMPQNWLLFIAELEGQPIASSLIALSDDGSVAYGRYWGALARVDCLHFEACYYQPIAWCIANGVRRFEGGAQGEHKMARALMPVRTSSAHWIEHPQFAQAIGRFLEREAAGVENYMDDLSQRSPLRQPTQG
jgi:predicted N-acyltransferase